MFRSSKKCLIAGLLAIALAVAPPAASASTTSSGPQPEGVGRMLNYAACALGIAGATGGLGIALAVTLCLIVLHSEVS